MEVPSVVGMTKNDAVTTFGKFLNVEVKEEKSTEVAEGEVISQEPEAGNWEDPDNVNVVITVSTGDQEPSAQSDSADTAASSDAPAQTADNSAAAAAGEVWKCTQTLNTPSGYSGGPVRLELIQNVNGTPTASVVLEDQVIQFPYDLDITGAPGISEGTLYLYEPVSYTHLDVYKRQALESLLTTLKEYHPHRLVCLFGCGGNRSKLRRYEMGEVSGKLADLTIITSDNPRDEEPQAIIDDIKIGMAKTDGKYVEIPDRKEAIAYAIHHGEPGDIIVLAGKGHEDYQEIKGKKYPMDERVLIADILAGK